MDDGRRLLSSLSPSVSPFTICSPEPRLASLLHLPLLPLATHWTLATVPHTTLTLATLATAATACKQQKQNNTEK